jgi:hypothetical protein
MQGDEVYSRHPCHLVVSLDSISSFYSHFAAAELHQCSKDPSERKVGYQVEDHHGLHGQDRCADIPAREVLAEAST